MISYDFKLALRLNPPHLPFLGTPLYFVSLQYPYGALCEQVLIIQNDDGIVLMVPLCQRLPVTRELISAICLAKMSPNYQCMHVYSGIWISKI